MLKWQDPLSPQVESNLQMLASDLRANKPRGWSVVFSKNEVIARPPDRKIGKFSITVVGERFCVSFFSRQLSIWNKRKYFRVSGTTAAKVKTWMEFEIDSPVKRVSE
jgi:hypothetical protein